MDREQGGRPEGPKRARVAVTLTHIAAAFAAFSWDTVLEKLTHYWPKNERGDIQPQPKYNPYERDASKRETPGQIAYAWVTWGRDVDYKFNRKTLPPQAPTPWLTALRDDIERKTGIQYDSVLINYCVAGAALSGHEDKGPTINRDVDITSVSFCKHPGYKRRFFLHHEPGPAGKDKQQHPLGHGDLFSGPLGTHLHGLMKPYKADEARSTSIVLTFRKMPTE
jgi:alkylated DNA repair dioxygenase AlkB